MDTKAMKAPAGTKADRAQGRAAKAAPEPGASRRRGARRAIILLEAARLFYERGYNATGMDDIGEAAGITGPAVYRHFKSKDELLLALIEESADRSEEDIRQLLKAGGSPAQLLKRLVQCQVEQSIDQHHLIGVGMREHRSLPPHVQAKNERRNRLNREEWAHIISQVRTDLNDAEVRAMVLGVKQLIFGVVTLELGLPPERLRQLAMNMVLAAINVDLGDEG